MNNTMAKVTVQVLVSQYMSNPRIKVPRPGGTRSSIFNNLC